VLQHQQQQRKNTMILEAFFSTVASNVFTEIIKQIAAERKRRKDEDIERIVDQVLRKYHSVGQSSIIEREIILILGNAGLVGSGGQLLPPSPHTPDLPELLRAWWDSRIYKIVSVASEKALDIPKDQMNNGVQIQQWDYWGGTNQQWKLIPVSGHDGLFKIHSQHSAKVLDVPIHQMNNGILIQQWSYWGGANQHWRVIPTDSTSEVFKILSAQSGKALDVPRDMTNNGILIQQWDDWGGMNQQWRLMCIQ
jgi:Ricin-type beta-trefoil lectin domain-like